jgi:hypothetical protein
VGLAWQQMALAATAATVSRLGLILRASVVRAACYSAKADSTVRPFA